MRERTHQDWLAEEMKKPGFKEGFEKELSRAEIAVRIAQIREEKGMTQKQLAKKLKTTQQAVSEIETFTHKNLTVATLEKLAAALDKRLFVDFR